MNMGMIKTRISPERIRTLTSPGFSIVTGPNSKCKSEQTPIFMIFPYSICRVLLDMRRFGDSAQNWQVYPHSVLLIPYRN